MIAHIWYNKLASTSGHHPKALTQVKKRPDFHFKQWHSNGFWCLGKLWNWHPFLWFFQENIQNGRPKTNLSHFQKWKEKKKSLAHFHQVFKLYRAYNITFYVVCLHFASIHIRDLKLTSLWQRCKKRLVCCIIQVNFGAPPPKWLLGHVPSLLLHPPATPLGMCYFCVDKTAMKLPYNQSLCVCDNFCLIS